MNKRTDFMMFFYRHYQRQMSMIPSSWMGIAIGMSDNSPVSSMVYTGAMELVPEIKRGQGY